MVEICYALRWEIRGLTSYLHDDTIYSIMSLDKLVEQFLREPPEVAFADVVTVLEAFGYAERSSGGGSHRVFVKPGHSTIVVPTIQGRRVKRVYIKMIIENLNLEDWYEERHGT